MTAADLIAQTLASHVRQYNSNSHRGILGGWNVDCTCGKHMVSMGESGDQDVFVRHQAQAVTEALGLVEETGHAPRHFAGTPVRRTRYVTPWKETDR